MTHVRRPTKIIKEKTKQNEKINFRSNRLGKKCSSKLETGCTECFTPFYALSSINKCDLKPKEPLTITESLFRDDSSKAKIRFSQDISDQGDFTTIEVTLLQSDKSTVIPSTVQKIEVEAGKTIAITVEPTINEVNGGVLKVKFMDRKEIREKNDPMIFLKEEQVEVGPVNYYKAGAQEQSVQAAAATAQAGVQTVMGASFVFSASSAFVLIKILQMVDFMTLINVKHPRNLSSFIEIISQSVVDIVPNVFNFMSSEQCIYNKEKFEEEEISCHITLNLGNYFAFIILLFLVFILLKILYSLCKKTRVGRWLTKPLKSMGIVFWLDFVESIQLDIYLSLFISAQKFTVRKDRVTTINYIISIVCGIGCLINTIAIMSLTGKAYQANNLPVDEIEDYDFVEKYQDYDVLYEDNKEEKFYQRQNRGFRALKDLLIAFLVVLFHDYTTIQTFFLILTFLGFLIADVVYRPCQIQRHNNMEVFKGALYMICIGFFFVLSIVQDKWVKRLQFNYIGYPVIGLITLIVVGNVGFGIYEMFLSVKEKCKGKKGKE